MAGYDPTVPAAGGGRPFAIATAVAALILVVTAFLPWLTVQVDATVSLPNMDFGGASPLGSVPGAGIHQTVTTSGIGLLGGNNVWGLVTLLSGVAAAALAIGTVAAGKPRTIAWAAIPGGVALLSLVVVLVEALSPGQSTGMLSATVQATMGFGWYSACVLAVAVTALALAGLVKARASRA